MSIPYSYSYFGFNFIFCPRGEKKAEKRKIGLKRNNLKQSTRRTNIGWRIFNVIIKKENGNKISKKILKTQYLADGLKISSHHVL